MITLNPSQAAAKVRIPQVLQKEEGIILLGSAGMGKSFLLKDIIRSNIFSNVLVLAETNQAVNLLREDLGHTSATFKTICSALLYELERTLHGFQLVRRRAPDWSEFSVVILDEGSQVPKVRFAEIRQNARRLIISGDELQAPPVGEKESPAFNAPFRKVSLTIPMRNDSEIFQYLQKVRATIGNNKRFPQDYSQDTKVFEKGIKAELEAFNNGSAVILAYSEKGKRLSAVTDYNKLIKQELFGSSELPQVGERIVFKKPYIPFQDEAKEPKQNKDYPIFTNQRGIITDCTSHTIFFKNHRIPSWRADFSCLDYPGVKLHGYMPKDEHDPWFQAARTVAFASGKPAVKEFFGQWAHFQSSYAVNAYVSQGLSIPKVFVDYRDISACTQEDLLLRQKIFYVCVSRASEQLSVRV